MVDIPLILPTGSTIGRDGQDASARLINAYAESLGKDGKAPFAVYGSPGLRRWDDGDFVGAARDLIELNNNALIGILGNEIVSFDQGGVSTAIATIGESGRVMTTVNRAATPQITILLPSGQVKILAGGAIADMSDTDLPTPCSADYLKGFTLYGIPDGRIFASDLEDSSSVAADAFGIARGESSTLVRAFTNAGFLYAMKEKSSEIWQPDPTLAAEAFPFSPVQQNIDIGLGAKFSPAALQRGIAWVDDEGMVRLGRDGSAERISTHSVERAIEDLTKLEREAIYGFVHTHQGHEAYVLTSANWTWIFDSLTKEWYEQQSYGRLNWRVNSHVTFNKQHIVGNSDDGKLYVIDSNIYSDAGEHQVMEIWCAQSHRFPGAMKIDCLELDVISGTGTANTVDAAAARPGIDDAFTKSLLHFNGVDASTTFTDESGKVWTAAGNAQIDTAEKKFGSASGLFDGTGDYISTPDHADFAFGSSDFTIDFWFNRAGGDGTTRGIAAQNDEALTATLTSFRIFMDTANRVQAQAFVGGTVFTVVGTSAFTANGFHHGAFVRTGNILKLFVDGVQEGGNVAISGSVNNSAETIKVGTIAAGGIYWNGWLDEFRISAGVARWTVDLTPPIREYGDPALVPEEVDPKIMVDYSDDGGHSFQGERQAEIGRIGNYRQKVQMNRWGRVDEKGRIWRLRASANVLKGVMGAMLKGEALDI